MDQSSVHKIYKADLVDYLVEYKRDLIVAILRR